MVGLARAAMGQMPPACRFSDGDAEVIRTHKAVLLALEPHLIDGFYDTVYAHPPTAAVFTEGERPAREVTLSQWWRRTVEGPVDDQYFAWMAMVGLVHVLRRVSNPMMLGMADFVANLVGEHAALAQLEQADAEALTEAFGRLASTVGAIITYGYDQSISAALFSVAGMPEALLARLRDQEVAAALTQGRQQLSRS